MWQPIPHETSYGIEVPPMFIIHHDYETDTYTIEGKRK